MKFKLCFVGFLFNNDDGYELMKQYNQLIKQKQYLEDLTYDHYRIGGYKYGKSKHTIKQLIERVDKL